MKKALICSLSAIALWVIEINLLSAASMLGSYFEGGSWFIVMIWLPIIAFVLSLSSIILNLIMIKRGERKVSSLVLGILGFLIPLLVAFLILLYNWLKSY